MADYDRNYWNTEVPGTQLEEIAFKIMSLKQMYNIFKNLPFKGEYTNWLYNLRTNNFTIGELHHALDKSKQSEGLISKFFRLLGDKPEERLRSEIHKL